MVTRIKRLERDVIKARSDVAKVQPANKGPPGVASGAVRTLTGRGLWLINPRYQEATAREIAAKELRDKEELALVREMEKDKGENEEISERLEALKKKRDSDHDSRKGQLVRFQASHQDDAALMFGDRVRGLEEEAATMAHEEEASEEVLLSNLGHLGGDDEDAAGEEGEGMREKAAQEKKRQRMKARFAADAKKRQDRVHNASAKDQAYEEREAKKRARASKPAKKGERAWQGGVDSKAWLGETVTKVEDVDTVGAAQLAAGKDLARLRYMEEQLRVAEEGKGEAGSAEGFEGGTFQAGSSGGFAAAEELGDSLDGGGVPPAEDFD